MDRLSLTARVLVSKDKYRLKDDVLGVDLDLTYITKRIIAMGVPAGKFDALYRNHENDVAKYLNHKHENHYMIYNLSEKHYTYSKFNFAVKEFGWPDHHAPTLELLHDIVTSMVTFLNEHPKNVIAVHCKAGRGRTGTAIACLLYQIKIVDSIGKAISYFGQRRSSIGEGVQGPSQIRLCNYYHHVAGNGMPIQRKLNLIAIEMKPIPAFIDKFSPCFELASPKTPKMHYFSNLGSHPQKYGMGDYSANLSCNVELDGDFLVRVFQHSTVTGSTLLFRIQCHTAFLQSPKHDFRCRSLDAPQAGPLRDSRFTSQFCVTLHFAQPNALDLLPPVVNRNTKGQLNATGLLPPVVNRKTRPTSMKFYPNSQLAPPNQAPLQQVYDDFSTPHRPKHSTLPSYSSQSSVQRNRSQTQMSDPQPELDFQSRMQNLLNPN